MEEIFPSLCFSFWTNLKSDDNDTGNLQRGTTPRSTSKLPMCITGYVFNNIKTYQHSFKINIDTFFFRFVPQLRCSKTTMRTWLKERSQSLIGALCSGRLFIWYTSKMLEVYMYHLKKKNFVTWLLRKNVNELIVKIKIC